MPKNLGDRKRMYDEARVKFFETCIVEGQEKAIQKILNIKAMADEEKKNEKRLLIRRDDQISVCMHSFLCAFIDYTDADIKVSYRNDFAMNDFQK